MKKINYYAFHLSNNSKKLIYSSLVCAIFSLPISYMPMAKSLELLISQHRTPKTLKQVSSPLLPGTYYRGSGYIGIHQLEDRFCYTGYNARGGVTASLSEVANQPGVYVISGFESDTTLSQSSRDILTFGVTEYERIEEAVPLEQTSAEVQSCLTSTEPYFYQEDFNN